MKGIDALRKNYMTLSPREKVSMYFLEATGYRREEVALALRPSSNIEALEISMFEFKILLIAGNALTAALIEENDTYSNMTLPNEPFDEVFCAGSPPWRRDIA